MPIRNPFRKAAGGVDVSNHDARDAAVHDVKNGGADGPRTIEIPDPVEYKLSGP